MVDALTPYKPPRFIVGLDVGQLSDPSAMTVLQRQMRIVEGRLDPYFFAGWLERLPLQMPYPAMVKTVRTRLEPIGERCALIVDATGVGRGVVDLFREGWTDYDRLTMERVTRPGKPTIIAVTLLTNALSQPRAERWDEWHVSRREVIMAFLLCLQQQRFQGAASLPELHTLIQEAKAFQWKASAKGEEFDAWTTGHHDDLLLATAVAVWWGQLYAPSLAATQGTQYATSTGNPLARRVGVGGRR
jgi:hypothetical protein